MLIAFLILAAAICILAVVYPYLIYPALLAATKARPIQLGASECGDGADFTLLFCAYNEASAMPQKLANLRDLRDRYPAMQFMAFDDGSKDGTADLIARDAPFVQLVRGGGRNGKAHGMKLMARQASTPLLVFTDANVLLDLDAPQALAACYSDSSVGGVCGALHYLGADGSSTAAVGGLYWRLEERIKDLESRSGSVMGADGSIFSIRAELYPEFPDTVLDDFTVSMSVVFNGLRLIKSNAVIAYEQLVSSRGDEFARKVRIAARAYHTHSELTSKRRKLSLANRFRYFSHKTLRWFGGAFLLAGAAFGIAAVSLIWPLAGVFVAVLIGTMVVIGIYTHKGPISSVLEIVLAMLATLQGVARAARGQTFAVWNPAKSR
ncbi:glycosyltransferase [Stenotrophomonas bentonitica]|uniref:Glycosyltransferase n=1 Tax=Stenotrophomonas bentonitica TaxID=1450134 RepID=A0ABU9JN62_9GAMM